MRCAASLKCTLQTTALQLKPFVIADSRILSCLTVSMKSKLPQKSPYQYSQGTCWYITYEQPLHYNVLIQASLTELTDQWQISHWEAVTTFGRLQLGNIKLQILNLLAHAWLVSQDPALVNISVTPAWLCLSIAIFRHKMSVRGSDK